MNYKEDLKIDVWNLHVEARDQPQLFMKYAEAYVAQKREVAYQERQLKVVRATTAQKIRQSSEKLKVDEVKEQVELSMDVIVAEQALIEATYKRDLLYSAVEAFKDRKSEIAELASLYKTGYYSQGMTVPEREIVYTEDEKQLTEELQAETGKLKDMKRKLQK